VARRRGGRPPPAAGGWRSRRRPLATSSRRAVITGVGVLCPVGRDPASYWRSLLEGKSGVCPIRAFDASALPVRFAGQVPDFNPKEYILGREERKALRMMARTIQLAVAAANRALQDGAVDKAGLDQ